MAEFTENQRWVIRRTNVAGVEPTTASTSTIVNTMVSTDIFAGELFYNTIDNKLWIGNSGSTTLINGAAVSTAWSAGAGSNTLVSTNVPTGTTYTGDDTVIVPSLTILASIAPNNPNAGAIYFDSTTSSWFGYDGTEWIEFITICS